MQRLHATPQQAATTLAVQQQRQPTRCSRLQPPQQQLQQPRASAASLAAAALVAGSLLSVSSAANAAAVDTTFATKCAGCHLNGGNVLQAGATLFQEDLVRNKADSADSLYALIYSGKARMPGFGADCAPKLQCTFGPRLSDEEIRDLVKYVQDSAAAGWKQQ